MNKKLIGTFCLLACLLFTQPCFAVKIAVYKGVLDASGNLLSNYNISAGNTVYSEPINVTNNVGYCTVIITENNSSGLGSIDLSVEYSVDGTNWYTAYTSSGGVLTADDKIVSALQNSTRWIVYTPRLSRLMRYKIYANADSTVTLIHIQQEEN